MELTEKQVRKLAEDRIFKCYGDGYCDLDAMINLFIDGYSEATRQINLTIPVVSKQGNGGVCKITNDKFSWVLEVDGKTITFNGSDNADYFAEIYTKLGYTIEWNRDKWKID